MNETDSVRESTKERNRKKIESRKTSGQMTAIHPQEQNTAGRMHDHRRFGEAC